MASGRAHQTVSMQGVVYRASCSRHDELLRESVRMHVGASAFSMEKIRLLAIQESLAPFPNLIPDEENTQIYPFPDTELLSNIARSEHILGGPGALQRWMEALSRPSNSVLR